MKIAIAGYGREGHASYEYWNRDGNELVILDEHEVNDAPAGVEVRTGADVFTSLGEFDMVVRTASLSPKKLVAAKKIWSATNEFFAKCPAPIVGVTGTKGKGTTCSLIVSILRAAGKTVHLVGNIGTPALAELPNITAEDVVVYELSSFQLWDIEYSPKVAVLLGVEPGHLDIHEGVNDYYGAKANIFRWQAADDIAICHPHNSTSQKLFTTYTPAKNRLYYASKHGGGVYIDGHEFRTSDTVVAQLDDLQLPGPHNAENACAALSVAVEMAIEQSAMAEGLRDCKGLEHRLEYVRSVGSVTYVNDSFSSAPSATVAALHSYDAPKVMIIGGINRGADFSNLARELAMEKALRTVLVVGESRKEIANIFAKHAVSSVEVLDADNMKDIVQVAKARAKNSDVVILSPGCASFDMFKDFSDRGAQFKDEVSKL